MNNNCIVRLMNVQLKACEGKGGMMRNELKMIRLQKWAGAERPEKVNPSAGSVSLLFFHRVPNRGM
ncbi:MAG: hypothetical protein ABSA83_16380 [Verrucomicrobiota bacterium]